MSSDKTLVHDGFPVRIMNFAVPGDTISLDPKAKRELTICNLFINHKLTVPDIIRVLDEDYRHVVRALLNSGIVRDRRQERHALPETIERRRSGN
jgi:hypothetical protein